MAKGFIGQLQGNTFNIKQWLGAGLLAAACMAGQQAVALQPLTDTEMAAATGQSLIALSVINENDPGNNGLGGANQGRNLTFYKLSIQGLLELNLNIDRLQLGCGGANTGINGTDTAPCDLDIERLRLHGKEAKAEGQPIVIGQPEVAGPDTGPRGSALLTNPYVELAIKNNSSPSTRQLAGLRFGSEKLDGATSIGENTDTTSVTDDTGFNSFSGYARFSISELELPVGICALAANASRSGCLLGGPPLVRGEGTIYKPTGNPATNNKHFHTVDEVRLTTTDVEGIPLLTQGLSLGPIGIPDILPLVMSANMTLGLKTLHRIDFVNSDDVFISVQKENIRWKQVKPNYDEDVDPNGNIDEVSNFYGGTAWSANMERGWALNTPEVEFKGFRSSRLHVGTSEVIAPLGGSFIGLTIPLDVGAVDTGALPADNCWGPLTFC